MTLAHLHRRAMAMEFHRFENRRVWAFLCRVRVVGGAARQKAAVPVYTRLYTAVSCWVGGAFAGLVRIFRKSGSTKAPTRGCAAAGLPHSKERCALMSGGN